MRGTVRELADRCVVGLRRRTGRPTMTSPGGPLDWDLDAGGTRERERFLRDVEAGVFGR